MSESPIPEPDTPAVQPVPVADQLAAGVPREETVTLADQRAGADPPPQVQPEAPAPEPAPETSSEPESPSASELTPEEPAPEEDKPSHAERLRGLFSDALISELVRINDRLDKAGL